MSSNTYNPPLLTALYSEAEDYFFKSISSKYLKISDGATAYLTGALVEELNLVYIRKSPDRILEIITKCRQFYEKEKLPFVVIIPKEICLPGIRDALSSIEYTKTDVSAAMAINLRDHEINIPDSDTEITILPNKDNLRNWIIPLREAFNSTQDISLYYKNAHLKALSNKRSIYHFSLYRQNNPVSSITLPLYKNVSRIDDVSTLPKFQDKGYASRLISYTLLESKKRGATYCFLESTISGFTVYKKLGFKTFFTNNIYSSSTQEISSFNHLPATGLSKG